MIVPSVTIAERPFATCELVPGRDIALQSRRKVIRIAVRVSYQSLVVHGERSSVPKVEVLGHVHLLEDVHQALLLCRLVYPVVERNRDDVRALTVVDVVTADEGNDGTLGDEDHVPARSELDEAYTLSRQTFAYEALIDVPAIPKKTRALPKPPHCLLPSSSIFSMALICFPL